MRGRLVSAGLLTALVAGCLMQGQQAPAQIPSASPSATADVASTPVKLDLAVVDYKELLKQHPSYDKLKDIDEQIKLLEKEKEFLPYKSRGKAQAEARKTMEAEFAKARAQLEAEKSAVEGQLQGLASSMSGQMAAEGARLKAEAEATLRQYQQQVAPPQPTAADIGNQSIREYMENLSIMRSQKMTAKRLELEKSMGNAVDAERARLDADAAAFEDSLRAKRQDELVNLNLKVRLAKDDTEQKAVREQIDAINNELDAAKQSKRGESEGQFKAFYSEQKGRMDSEIAAYEAQLNKEIDAKAGIRRQELASKAPAQTPNGPPPDVAAKIEKMRAEMNASMQAKQAQLKARMESEQASATARLRAKQEEIAAHLKVIQDGLMKNLADRAKFMDKETKVKMDQVEKNLTKAIDERKALFKSMSEEINKAVGDVATKQKIAMVIGDVYLNLDKAYPDLTDFSMVAVKQLRSK
jgi:hypothetical protein